MQTQSCTSLHENNEIVVIATGDVDIRFRLATQGVEIPWDMDGGRLWR
jgi:hypothetical protein